MTNPIEQDGPTKMGEAVERKDTCFKCGAWADEVCQRNPCEYEPRHRKPKPTQPTTARMLEGEDRTVTVPREPTEAMLAAIKAAMPVEYRYWREGGMLHCRILDDSEAVQPASIYRAMLSAVEKK